MTAKAPLITAENLTKTYPAQGKAPAVHAVQGVTFVVQPGTCTGLLGPNGAGKSTTMRMLMGLTRKSGGSLSIFGTDTESLSRTQRTRISLVPQDDNLDPDLTVAENLFVYGLFFGIARATLKDRVPQLLAYMQLEDKADARVSQLSGGMKRRLTLARALVNDPDLIIMDEPTTGLDPQARVMIWQRVLELKKQGKTILLTTHYMDEAQRLCDHIILIDHGTVLDEGTPKQLIARHSKPHVFDVTKPVPAALGKLKLGEYESEDVGDSILYYVEDAITFRKQLPETATYLHRPANMEDVFLKLTGRKLRE
ncbi:MAG: ATP-binding cassette domain-containing protein [Pseudomonadaceae bacterium]|nr:ATP-binding cassette domain-containing protein [Pseudomonadaceae bacterium]